MKKKLFLLSISFFFLFQSCSEEEIAPVNVAETPIGTAITLSSNTTTIILGQTVTLQVIDNLNVNVTFKSSFTANNEFVSSKDFKPSIPGVYNLVARKGIMISNTVTITVVPGVRTKLTLSAAENTTDIGKPVVLKVFDNFSADITSECTFTANDVAFNGLQFTPTSAGTYKIVAKNGTLTSNEVEITVKDQAAINTIFYEGKNYPITNSAIQFIGKAAPQGSSTPTVGLFRLVGYNSNLDFTDATGTPQPTNIFSIVIRVPLDTQGNVVAPDRTNITYNQLESLKVDNTVITISSNQNGTVTFGSNLPTVKNAPFLFKITSNFNNSSRITVDFNGNFNGSY